MFNEFLIIIKSKNIQFGYNQEDSGELLLLLLDIIDDKYIYNLFQHKYKCDMYCKSCKNLKEVAYDTSVQFEIDLNEINDKYLKYNIDNNLSNLNKYIRNNYSEVSNYKCPKCQSENIIKLNRLLIIPTIIIINLNKYNKKSVYNYPIDLIFINQSMKNQYTYKLISTIEHSGSMNYGHYISNSIRKNHEYNSSNNPLYNIYTLNDNSYQKGNLQPKENTYILIYHYIETTDYIETTN